MVGIEVEFLKGWGRAEVIVFTKGRRGQMKPNEMLGVHISSSYLVPTPLVFTVQEWI